MQNNKIQGTREFIQEHLREDILDPQNLPLRETSLNFAISIIRLAVTAFNVGYHGVQFGFSLLLALGDLIAKGLQKAMPAPRVKMANDDTEIIGFRSKQ